MALAEGVRQEQPARFYDAAASFMEAVERAHRELAEEILHRTMFELDCLTMLAHEVVEHTLLPRIDDLDHGRWEPESVAEVAAGAAEAWGMELLTEHGDDERLKELLCRHNMPPEAAGRYYKLARRLTERARELVSES
ncbi:MAG: hypothetical protein IMX02_02850 [Limnochordaceae bacterium]|nr:hypothetical protein [Limnochordaceae bacterium]